MKINKNTIDIKTIFKNPFFILLFLLLNLFINATGFAQRTYYNEFTPKNVVKFNVISPYFQTYHLAYHRKLAYKMSAQIGVSYTHDFARNQIIVRGFSITPEFRYHLTNLRSDGQLSPAGIYLAGAFRFTQLSLRKTIDVGVGGLEVTAPYTQLGFSALIGQQFLLEDKEVLLDNKLTLDFFGGVTLNTGALLPPFTEIKEPVNFGVISLSLRLGVCLGYAF